MPRTLAIGDIHGCAQALSRLLAAVAPAADDTVITLGDYVDRGPDSPGVIEQLIALSSRARLKPLLGNHDLMLLSAPRVPNMFPFWLDCGGDTTLAAYGVRNPSEIPAEHFRFFESCQPFLELENDFLVHANYRPELAIADQPDDIRYWVSLRDYQPGPHFSGKRAVLGHTPQEDVLDLGYLLGIDTGCVYGGWLTAVELTSGEFWQSNEAGELRTGRLERPQRSFDPPAPNSSQQPPPAPARDPGWAARAEQTLSKFWKRWAK